MYQHKAFTLKNGLGLITIPMPQVESMTALIGVGAGSRYETLRTNGISHFFEHMTFKGSKKRPTALDISTAIEAIGGEFNAATGKEMTSFYVKAAAKHLPLALDVLVDMVLNSKLDKGEIEREKGVIIEEINLYEDTPVRRVSDIFETLLYGATPLGWDVAGKKENVRRIKREDFTAYINRLYHPVNMVVAIAGKFEPKKVESQVKKYLGKSERGEVKEARRLAFKQTKPQLKLGRKKTEQAHFCLGVPGVSLDHPDRWALGVLSVILGAGMSSRLFIEVRVKRGLAYYVRTSPEFYTDNGYLVTQAGVDVGKIEEAIKVVLSEYKKIALKKVPGLELKKAKEFLKGSLILALEDSYATALRYATLAILEKKMRTPEETMKLIDKVTATDVLRVAKDIFAKEKLNLAVIGPYKSKKRFERLLLI